MNVEGKVTTEPASAVMSEGARSRKGSEDDAVTRT